MFFLPDIFPGKLHILPYLQSNRAAENSDYPFPCNESRKNPTKKEIN